jgi:hypothetical protein
VPGAAQIELDDDDFEQLVARYDPAGSGVVDYTAFVTSLVPPSYSADWAASGSTAARSARASVTHDLTLAEFESLLADRLQHATGCFGNTAPSSVHKVNGCVLPLKGFSLDAISPTR